MANKLAARMRMKGLQKMCDAMARVIGPDGELHIRYKPFDAGCRGHSGGYEEHHQCPVQPKILMVSWCFYLHGKLAEQHGLSADNPPL